MIPTGCQLRSGSWHLIHLWAYVAMGLAVPHQLVSRDFGVGWTPVYWWALYLVALAVVVVFGVAVPLRRTADHRLQIAELHPEGPTAVSVIMAGHRLDRLGARAGQFFGWRFGGSRGWSHAHPYSLSQAPSPDRLRVTVATTGDGGGRVPHLRVGARVIIEGPYGNVTADDRRHPRLLMIAAGIGITPFRALLEGLALQPGEATLIYRAHDTEEFSW